MPVCAAMNCCGRQTTAHALAEPKILPHKAKARESTNAESPYPPMDSSTNRQHNQVRSGGIEKEVGTAAVWTDMVVSDTTQSGDIGARPSWASDLNELMMRRSGGAEDMGFWV